MFIFISLKKLFHYLFTANLTHLITQLGLNLFLMILIELSFDLFISIFIDIIIVSFEVLDIIIHFMSYLNHYVI